MNETKQPSIFNIPRRADGTPTRRGFLKLTEIVSLGLALAACAPDSTAVATAAPITPQKVTGTELNNTPPATEIFKGVTITPEMLTPTPALKTTSTALAAPTGAATGVITIEAPQSEIISGTKVTTDTVSGSFANIGGPEVSAGDASLDLLKYNKDLWGSDFSLQALSENPVKAYQFWMGTAESLSENSTDGNGIIKFPEIQPSEQFPFIPPAFNAVRLKLPKITQPGADILNASPSNLTINRGGQNDSHLIIFGNEGSQVFAGITSVDPATGKKSMYLAEIALTPDQKISGTTLAEILAASNITYSELNGNITLPGAIISPNAIDPGLAASIRKASGVYFENLTAEGKLHPNPVVPYPPENIIKLGYSTVTKTEEGKIVAQDKSGKTIATANFDEKTNSWAWKEVKKEPQALRDYADILGIKIGTLLSSFHILDPGYVGQEYLNISGREFNELGGEDVDWHNQYGHALRPTPTDFDWTLPDASINFAQARKMDVTEFHLLWGEESLLPDWLKNGNLSQEQLLSTMENHIKTVVGRYKGKVKTWSVVNELLGLPWDPNGHHSFWHDKLGPDFVAKAFTWAHEADPEAKLILNDFGIEMPGSQYYYSDRDDKMFNLVKDLKAQGIPIDGVGFQMHLWAKEFTTPEMVANRSAALKQNIQKYQSLGVEVMATELDMRLNDLPGDDAQKQKIQSDAYAAVIKACIEAGIKTINIWGLTDKYAQEQSPVLFDENNQPKPAYTAVLGALQELTNQ